MKLPVLMYHDVTTNSDKADFLTIPVAILEQQLQHIRQQGYTPISLQQFHQYLTTGKTLPHKPVLLTFDDGYKSNLQLLYPLLQQYELRAGIFLVSEFVRQTAFDKTGKYLNPENLQQMNTRYIDYGYHSYSHNSYGDLSVMEMESDVQKMKMSFRETDIPMVPLFAYPYGASPRKDAAKMLQLQEIFRQHGIEGAFRIGNRLSSLPIENKYQIQRIDIRGNDPFWKFKLMLRFGRKWIG